MPDKCTASGCASCSQQCRLAKGSFKHQFRYMTLARQDGDASENRVIPLLLKAGPPLLPLLMAAAQFT